MKKYLVCYKDKKLYGTFERLVEAENIEDARKKIIVIAKEEDCNIDKRSIEVIEDYYI